VAVSLSLANRHAGLPVAWRLYLPQEWAADPARRRKAHVPADITFKTKAEIALDQLRWACAAGLPRGVVLPDAGYGNNSDLRAEITALDLTYVAGMRRVRGRPRRRRTRSSHGVAIGGAVSRNGILRSRDVYRSRALL
jgi:SRSO17 transposase